MLQRLLDPVLHAQVWHPAELTEAWRQTYFGSAANSGAGEDLSDPDRDGVVNVMEFATGSGPWGAAGVSTVVFTDGSVMQQMKSTLPAGGSGKRFLRLRVSRL